MPITNPEPYRLSHVCTKNGSEYVIIQYKTYGLELERAYTVHLCDIKSGLLNRTPIHQIYLPNTKKYKYKKYYKNFLGLLSYVISTEILIPGRTQKGERLYMTFEILDKWIDQMKKDIADGNYDSHALAYPEI